MYRYEITERGKILIAIVLVVILLVLSSFVVFISYCSGTSPPETPSLGYTPSPPPTDDPTIQSTPLPSPGSGFEPTPTPPVETPEPPTPQPTEPPPSGNGNGNGHGDDIPEYGPVGLNITEGTMLFMFSPALQETLDEDTVTMLSEFLSSPKNTEESMVQVEMPNLTEDDTTLLLSAVGKAFSTYNVKLSDIVYVKNQTEVKGINFEVKLSFYVASVSK